MTNKMSLFVWTEDEEYNTTKYYAVAPDIEAAITRIITLIQFEYDDKELEKEVYKILMETEPEIHEIPDTGYGFIEHFSYD